MKHLKMIIAVCLAVMLSACGAVDRQVASLTGYSKVCVDGVIYLQFTSGSAVQVDATGKPVVCK